jgi:hypothetical protein
MRSLFVPLLPPGSPFPEPSLTVPGGAAVKVPETVPHGIGHDLSTGEMQLREQRW